jgi:pimeloyl-ACP methyl ester carboxylesterase
MMFESPTAQVLSLLRMAEEGRFEDISDLFVEQLRPMVSADVLRASWDAEIRRNGAVTAIGQPTAEPGPQGMVVVRAPITTQRGSMALVASLTPTGEVTALQLAPPEAAQPTAVWQPPTYAFTDRFEEEEVTVGPAPLAVPGTLTIPKQPRPCPAVVLLAGSGPNDRDETVGRNKIFKDLAWGLASAGLCVLRFDKVTFAHPAAVRVDPSFTAVDEYVPHAVAGVRLLRERDLVAHDQIFVLGHSLGGTVAPRVAVAEPAVAGLVLLAAGIEPLHWSAVRQMRHLASLDPATAAASRSVIDRMTEQAKLVDSLEPSSRTPASELPFGVPAAYWLDLRRYQRTRLQPVSTGPCSCSRVDAITRSPKKGTSRSGSERWLRYQT